MRSIQPGKPTQNAYIERFNGTYRRGVLNRYIFDNLDQVREQTQVWMDDYNHHRPHDALGNLPQIEYVKKNLNKASLVEIDQINDNIVLTNSSI
ncbi:hypothetical protein GCM10023163_05950 [Aestuariibaculum suncheonense]